VFWREKKKKERPVDPPVEKKVSAITAHMLPYISSPARPNAFTVRLYDITVL
jgi:hypothetical protein